MNHDCVIKIGGKASNYKKLLEFFQNRKAFDLNQVINAAVVPGETGVTFILELNNPESLKDCKVSLYAVLEFKAYGPLYNYSKLAYEIIQYIRAILLFKDD